MPIFQSYELNATWWESFEDPAMKLCILCFGTRTRLRFILPGYIKQKIFFLLQNDHADILDAIYDPTDDMLFYCSGIAKMIREIPEISTVQFAKLNAASPLLSCLPYFFGENKCIIHKNSGIPVIEKSQYEGSNLLKFQNKDRHYKMQKLLEGSDVCSAWYPGPFPEQQFKELSVMLIRHYHRDPFYYNSLMEYVKTLYEKKMVRIFISSKDGIPVHLSFVLSLKENAWLSWVSVYNPEIPRIDIIRLINLVRSAREHGSELWFGTGLYKQKIELFHPRLTPLFNLKFSKKEKKVFRFLSRKLIDLAY
ncbi:MAG: hypothetical protein NTW10_12075 [Bacteroidetes bacterium]|nr:hypothetical protein [Bacteroidota bacterium]